MEKTLEFKTLSARTERQVDATIASSKNHASMLKTTTVLCLLMLSVHGRAEQMNKLFNGVSNHDAEGIRNFVKAVHAKYGWQDDRKVVRGPFAVKRSADGKSAVWSLNANADAEKVKEARAKIEKAGETGLEKLGFGPSNRVERATREFDAEESLKQFIMRAAKEGTSVGWLKQINHLIPADHRLADADIAAAANKVETDLAKAKERVAKLEKAVAERSEKDEPKAETKEKQAA